MPRTLRGGLLLLVALSAPRQAQAQITIGTDPSAETTLGYAPWFSDWVGQSFRAAGSFLTRLSFWYYGGATCLTYAGYECGGFSSWFYITDGLGPLSGQTVYGSDGFDDTYALDQTVQGRYDIYFDDYLPMIPGSSYTFAFYGTDCWPSPCGHAPIEDGLPRYDGEIVRPPQLEYTTTDAYADGSSWQAFGPSDRDIRFEATFADHVMVPEPSAWLLVGTGLLGLGFVAWRRKEEDEAG